MSERPSPSWSPEPMIRQSAPGSAASVSMAAIAPAAQRPHLDPALRRTADQHVRDAVAVVVARALDAVRRAEGVAQRASADRCRIRASARRRPARDRDRADRGSRRRRSRRSRRRAPPAGMRAGIAARTKRESLGRSDHSWSEPSLGWCSSTSERPSASKSSRGSAARQGRRRGKWGPRSAREPAAAAAAPAGSARRPTGPRAARSAPGRPRHRPRPAR